MTNDSQVQQALTGLDSPELSARIDALLQLRGHQDEQIAPKVIPLLRDREATIRRLAAEVLSRSLSTSAIVQPLIDALFDENPAVRAAVADALGQLGDRTAVQPLIDALYDENIDVRFAATEALKLIMRLRLLASVREEDGMWVGTGKLPAAKIEREWKAPLKQALKLCRKLQRQIALFGRSATGMPPAWAYRGSDGVLVLTNGVTRATRIAKLAPGMFIPVEVVGDLKYPVGHYHSVGDRLP